MKRISKNTKAIKIIMPTDEDFAKIKKFYRFGDVMPTASDSSAK